jgi:hypothetical protein
MTSKIFSRIGGALLFVMALTLLPVLTGCSDDNDSTPTRYALQINGQSLNYASNTALNAKVQEIIAQYCPATPGYMETSLANATKTWQKACDAIRTYNWDKADVVISDSTFIDLALVKVSDSDEGNTVINRYRITFPYFLYRFIVSNETANYGLNIKAQQVVSKIIAHYGPGEQNTFKGTNNEAIERFNALTDSIGHYNWRSNDLGIQKNTGFKLSLVFGTYLPTLESTVVKEQDITLSNN